jgi:hypothetical protein
MIWIIGIIIFILVIFFTGGFDRKHNKLFIGNVATHEKNMRKIY